MTLCLKSSLFIALAFCCLPAEMGFSQCCKKRNFETPMIPVWDQIGMMNPYQRSYGPPVWEMIGSMNPYQRISLPPVGPCVGCQRPGFDVQPIPATQPAPERVPISDEALTPTPLPSDVEGASTSAGQEAMTLAEMAEQKRRARAAAADRK